jgi:hypothetical protein
MSNENLIHKMNRSPQEGLGPDGIQIDAVESHRRKFVWKTYLERIGKSIRAEEQLKDPFPFQGESAVFKIMEKLSITVFNQMVLEDLIPSNVDLNPAQFQFDKVTGELKIRPPESLRKYVFG